MRIGKKAAIKEPNKMYWELCGIDATLEERKKYRIGGIFQNKAKCLLCGHVIVSQNRHDYRSCPCKNLSVDGGSWYCKRSIKKEGTYEELSEYYKQ